MSSCFSFRELGAEISWIKGSPGVQARGTPSGQSGGHLSSGGECFAPILELISWHHLTVLLAFPDCSHTLSWCLQTCSTSFPSGKQVDGLPLVANTGEDMIGPAPHP